MQDYIQINESDNVGVALRTLPKETEMECNGTKIILKEDIQQGHKFALRSIAKGEDVIKYGFSIGKAKTDIRQGEWIHTQNLGTGLGKMLDYTYQKQDTDKERKPDLFFQGYKRANGTSGIRNEIWIIPTVGCMNSVVKVMEKNAQKYLSDTVEDIIAYNHPYGCSQMGDDQENTRHILADLALHPNAGGVLIVGLGCENSNVNEIKKYLGEYDTKRIRFLVAQEVEDEIEAGEELIRELIREMEEDVREEIPVSELIIGLKCGGSDGLSGITANTTVGAFSDLLIERGGTTILTEVPEMFGAETLLLNRCETPELFEKTVHLINDFKQYFTDHGQTIYENPSPGNKAGGISTLEDKSLGCTQKSGRSIVTGVLGYGERVDVKGLNLLSAPGNDLVASTALAAAGAQIVLFTTGRGTPFAAPVPTVKISSNSGLFEKKENWIDFNAGRVIEDSSVSEMSQLLLDYVIRIANGEKVKSEKAGFHDMAIFKQGVTL